MSCEPKPRFEPLQDWSNQFHGGSAKAYLVIHLEVVFKSGWETEGVLECCTCTEMPVTTNRLVSHSATGNIKLQLRFTAAISLGRIQGRIFHLPLLSPILRPPARTPTSSQILTVIYPTVDKMRETILKKRIDFTHSFTGNALLMRLFFA